MVNKNIITVLSATIATSLCCITPVLAVLAGSSSFASSFSWLAPYHNYLVVFTVLVLFYAWYDKLKPSEEINCDCDSQGFFSGKTFLVIVTLFTAIMLSFPQWGSKFFINAPSAESCSTGSCSSDAIHIKPKDSQEAINSNLPVLKFINEERLNPTPYKQIACSGSGNKNLDAMMAQKRAEIDEMPPPVLLRMIDDDKDVILVDIREAKQKDGFTIPAMESYEMTYGQAYFSAFKNLQDRDNVVVVYGKFGMVSLFVASTLKKLGYKHVYSLKGGTDAWKLAGYPYEKIEEEE